MPDEERVPRVDVAGGARRVPVEQVREPRRAEAEQRDEVLAAVLVLLLLADRVEDLVPGKGRRKEGLDLIVYYYTSGNNDIPAPIHLRT